MVAAPAYAEGTANKTSAAAPAAGPPPTPSATAPVLTGAPDIVRMKDGGMLRGTIAESKAGQFVTIVLITGEARKIPAADYLYAGPVDAPSSVPAPAPAAAVAAVPAPNPNDSRRPLVTVEGPEARIQFESTPASVTLHRRSSSAGLAGMRGGFMISGYDEICTAPCRVSLPAGTYTFAGSKPRGRAVEADPVTLPSGTSILHATYHDHSSTRVMGVLVMVASIAGGLALEYDGFSNGPQTCDEFNICSRSANTTEIAAGLGVALAGTIVGYVILRIPDKIEFTVGPGADAAPSAMGQRSKAAELAASSSAKRGLPGLHLGLAF